MRLSKVHIKNYKSIKDSGEVTFDGDIFALVGQNESGKSSILEGLILFTSDVTDEGNLNFEEVQAGNFEMSIACTFELQESEKHTFVSRLSDNLISEFRGDTQIFDLNILRKLNYFTITKLIDFKNNKVTLGINDGTFDIIQGAVKNKSEIPLTGPDAGKERFYPSLLFDHESRSSIAKILLCLCPSISTYDEKTDILPDSIKIRDLKNNPGGITGFNATRNLEKLLNRSFEEINSLSIAQRKSVIANEIIKLSKIFQNDRTQKIYGDNKVAISFDITNELIGNGQSEPTVYFYIETKDNVLLEPRKRSKGLLRFLALWLELKVLSKDEKLIIILDEPGSFLHLKAHGDLLKLFNSLKLQGHQIIYSTHFPSLINVDDLSNIGLVINTKEEGTIVGDRNIGGKNMQHKEEALFPISHAMGLDPSAGFGILQKNNVILEGISDFWYFQAMKLMLDEKGDYKFIPGLGIKFSKIHSLISFCIGYGLNRLLVMDDGAVSKGVLEDLKDNLFNNESLISNFVKILQECNGVEQMFEVPDLKLTGEQIRSNKGKPNIANKKSIIAKKFFQKVSQGKIQQADLHTDTITRFKEIFERINASLKK